MTDQPSLFGDEEKARSPLPDNPRFDGATYDPDRDKARLKSQLIRVWNTMSPGQWLTLRQIAERTGDPEQSVSARIRDLRKPRFGEHTVERESVGSGIFRYRLIPNKKTIQEAI
jgi:hypothetical protein